MKDPKLFAITKPVVVENLVNCSDGVAKYEGPITPEQSIVYMARVSSPNQRSDDEEKLLRYLMINQHWSPLDMIDMVVEIETSRAIMAQILRHWSFRFQEFSQRYSEVESIKWDHVEARMKGSSNRQGSLEASDDDSELMESYCEVSEGCYNDLLRHGVAPESARMILPLATPTRAYMKGSVRSWVTYFWQRADSHAQKEHRELAEKMLEIFKNQFPVIHSIIIKHRPVMIDKEKVESIIDGLCNGFVDEDKIKLKKALNL